MFLTIKCSICLEVMLILTLFSCRGFERFDTLAKIERIRIGMLRTEVIEILGEPDREYTFVKNGRTYRRLVYTHPMINASTDPSVLCCSGSDVVISITLDDTRYVRVDGQPCSAKMGRGYKVRIQYLLQELAVSHDSVAAVCSVKLAESFIQSGEVFYEVFKENRSLFDRWLQLLASGLSSDFDSKPTPELTRTSNLKENMLRVNAEYLNHVDYGSMAHKLSETLSPTQK